VSNESTVSSAVSVLFSAEFSFIPRLQDAMRKMEIKMIGISFVVMEISVGLV
jgi:hypothetical protein